MSNSRALSRTVRRMPASVPDWALVPLDAGKQAFASRPPPLTQEELAAIDRAMHASKASGALESEIVRRALQLQLQEGGAS